MDATAFLSRYGPAALVTGASSGIGAAFAGHLAGLGFELLLVARREGRLRALASDLRQEHGVGVSVAALDLARADAVDAVAAAVSGLDIGLLVSNAGFGMKGAHHHNDPAEMETMLRVNCHAPMQLCHRLLPSLIKRGRGGLIITSSVEGLMGFPYSAAYAASKAFTNSLAESLWGEVQGLGIDVLGLCPGSTDTEAHAGQGIDVTTLEGMMSAEAVVAEALEHIHEGPLWIAGAHNRELFSALTQMPRREALLQAGKNIRRALLSSREPGRDLEV